MGPSSKFFEVIAHVEPPFISSSPRREASLNARAAKAFTFSKAAKTFAMKGASEGPGATTIRGPDATSGPIGTVYVQSVFGDD